MKQRFSLTLAIIFSTVLFAQEEEEAVGIDAEGAGAWYASPWVWVLGAAFFIFLLIIFTRGGSRKTE